MEDLIVYDKAEYHFEAVALAGLLKHQAYVHTGMFFGWILDHDLFNKEFFASESWQNRISDFKNRKISGPKLFEDLDGVLISDELDEEGNAFAKKYYDGYIFDYQKALQLAPGDDYAGADTWENYEKIKAVVDKRYENWKNGQ